MKRCKNLGELREEFDSVLSTVAGDTRFVAQALMFIAEQLVELNGGEKSVVPKPKPIRPVSGIKEPIPANSQMEELLKRR